MSECVDVVVEDEISVIVDPHPAVAEVIIANVGERGPQGIQGEPGVPAPSLNPMSFSRLGTQFVDTGTQRFYVDHPGFDLGMRVSLGTAPQGADFILVLRKNGSVLQTATVPAGQQTSGYITISPGTVSAGDYFTVDVTQVGSTAAGEDLTMTLWMRVTP